MALVIAGINHDTANIAFREKVAFPPEIVAAAIKQLNALEKVDEVVIVSTCNRTELYLSLNLAGDQQNVDLRLIEELEQNANLDALQSMIIDWLGHFHQLETDEIQNCSYFHWQEDVVRHLMKVCCGLET